MAYTPVTGICDLRFRKSIMALTPITSVNLTNPSGAGKYATPFTVTGTYLPTNATVESDAIHVTFTNNSTGLVDAEGDATMDGSGGFTWSCPALVNGRRYIVTVLTKTQGIISQISNFVVANETPDTVESISMRSSG